MYSLLTIILTQLLSLGYDFNIFYKGTQSNPKTEKKKSHLSDPQLSILQQQQTKNYTPYPTKARPRNKIYTNKHQNVLTPDV